jgi:hypothetical protein
VAGKNNIDAQPAENTATQAENDLKILIQDGSRLLQYIARHGDLTIDPDLAQGIARAKSRLETKYWNVEDEALLLQCYDQLARQVYPVTVESIKAVIPNAKDGKLVSPSASRVITWYRRYTVLTLLLLLIVQMYYLFGYSLTQTLSGAVSPPSATEQPHEHELEASYLLLKKWNRLWMLGHPLNLEASSPTHRHASSVQYAVNMIAAQSVLEMLQNYVLPLIYGLLGAFIFVLRSLLQQVRNLTYTASREVGYRLRLTLGCLAGMITGWLMKPDIGDVTLSPMALAFLAGYSIEVLFTLLDRLIDSIRRKPVSGDEMSPHKHTD